MNKVLTKSICCALFLAMAFFLAPTKELKAEKESSIQYVFLIVLDGIDSEFYTKYPTSNIRFIASEGASDVQSLCFPADTLEAGVASLLTGSLADDHKHYTGSNQVEVQSMLDIFKDNGRSFAIIDGSGGKLISWSRSEKDYLKIDNKENDNRLFSNAEVFFNTNKPFFTLIYSNDLFEAKIARDEKDYKNAITNIDRGIGSFLDSLRQQNLLDKSLIMMTSLRSNTLQNQAPLIIFGPKIKRNQTISGTIAGDIAPTIAELCGLSKPYASRGTAIYDAIDYSEENVRNMNLHYIKELKASRILNWQKFFTLDDEINDVTNQMAAIKAEKDEIISLAGGKENLIQTIKKWHNLERLIVGFVIIMLIAGYFFQYIRLKKKFLLFR